MDKRKRFDNTIAPLLVIKEIDEEHENSKSSALPFAQPDKKRQNQEQDRVQLQSQKDPGSAFNRKPTSNINSNNDANLTDKVDSVENELAKPNVDQKKETEISNVIAGKYIPPIEDPYEKAMTYLAKHNVLELFGDLTTNIVFKRPVSPLQSMVDALEKLQERELQRKCISSRVKRPSIDI